MRRRVGLLAVGGVVLAVGAVAALALWDRSDADERASADAAGDRPAVLDTTFEHFDGRVVRLADWEGTPMVVNFWASWCPPCVAEMGDAFEPVHAELGADVAFVGLNLEDDPDRAADVVDVTGVTYDLGRDPAGELFTGFGGFGMPTTIFIAADGAVVETHTGALSRARLERLIERSFGIGAS